MKRRTIVLVVLGLLFAGAVAGFGVRSIARLRALESGLFERTPWYELGRNADVVELEQSADSEPATDLGVFSIELPPGPGRHVDATGSPARLRAEYDDGSLVVVQARRASTDTAVSAEAAERFAPVMPWGDGSRSTAAGSPEATLWWAMENYHPATAWDVVWFGSDRYQAEFAMACALVVLRANTPNPPTVYVTDEAVAFWYVMDEGPPARSMVKLYSRRSMLTVDIIMQGPSVAWVQDTGERIARSFRDTCPPDASDEQIDVRVREAARAIEQP